MRPRQDPGRARSGGADPAAGRPAPVVAIIGGGIAGWPPRTRCARPARSDGAGGLAAAGRQAGRQPPSAGHRGRRRRRGPAGPPAGGRRPDRRAWAWPGAAPARHHDGRHLDPRRGPAAAPAAVHGRARRTWRAGRDRPAVARRAWPGPARTPTCRAARGGRGRAPMSRSPSGSAPGWAANWWTAWSSRCSAASTPGAARTCRSRPRWPPWPRLRPGSASLGAAAASLLPPAGPRPRRRPRPSRGGPAQGGPGRSCQASPPAAGVHHAGGRARVAAAGLAARLGRRRPDPGRPSAS